MKQLIDGRGTSVATPHVAATCALLKEARPSITARQTHAVLINSADFMADLYGQQQNGWHGEAGWGMLNAYSAVDQRFNIVDGVVNDPSDSRTYAVAIVPPGQNTVVTLTWQRVMTSDASPLVDSNGWESPARLDLFLETSGDGGQSWQPAGNTTTHDNPKSNVRQIRADQAPPGEQQLLFRVKVRHVSDIGADPPEYSGPQSFTLASRHAFPGGF